MTHIPIQATINAATKRFTFLESKESSESTSDRHDGLYSTWNVSGVFVENTIFSIGLKSKFISTNDRIMGRTGELEIFSNVLLSRLEMKKICAPA